MHATIVFRRQHFTRLTSYLYADRTREAMALGYYRLANGGGSRRILVQNLELPKESDYIARTPSLVSLKPDCLERVFSRCETEGLHVLDIHTHPWARGVSFSHIDDREARMVKGPYLKRYLPEVEIAYLLFGSSPDDAVARLWKKDTGVFRQVAKLIIW